MTEQFKQRAGGILLIPMAISALYSANTFGLRDRFPPPATLVSGQGQAAAARSLEDAPAIADAPAAEAPQERSQPWWQEVKTLNGTGDRQTDPVSIVKSAIQWRAAWKCETGSISAKLIDASGGEVPRPLVEEAACPAEGTGFSVRTGKFSLAVQASGPWSMTVEQQVDVPLVEPPMPQMAAPGARVVMSGPFYDVDRVGRGTIKIFEFQDGSRALRLEDFFVSQNSDLELRLSELAEPRTTPEIAAAPSKQLHFLLVTTGSMNFSIPGDVDLSKYRSMVIWCELTHNAYAAATLTRA